MSEAVFEEHRALLEGIAYRMCGTHADAEDIVQEVYLRWHAADRAAIRSPRSWLVATCTRLAIDHLKSARVRRERYVGPWLPEPLPDERAGDPAARTSLDDSVSIALMLAMEALTPTERAAFLLHDVFGYDFEEIAETLGKSEAACRKLASRARLAVRDRRPRFTSSPQEHRELLESFFLAARNGEMTQLKQLLAESVELHSDSGGVVKTAPAGLCGADVVAAFFLSIWGNSEREGIRAEPRWFNGRPGMLVFQDDALMAALCLDVEEGRISRIYAVRNPGKLARLR